MSLTPTIYRSTDPGAPLLSGSPGALVTLLDAILVSGYGVGADQKAGLGWTKPFTGSALRVYRNNPVTGTGCYLRVDDAGARSSLLRMYSAMTGIDDGADPTPSAALRSAGCRWDKSTVDSGAARHWLAIGTEKFFYLFIDTNNEFQQRGYSATHPHYAGDLASLKPGDRHHFALSYKGSEAEASGIIGYGLRGMNGWAQAPDSDSRISCYIGRDLTASPGSLPAILTCTAQTTQNAFGSNSALPPYPYAGNSGLLYAPIEVLEGAYRPRGFLPGIYAPLHRRPFPEGLFVTDVAGFPVGTNLLSKGYQTDSMSWNENYAGQVLIDAVNPW